MPSRSPAVKRIFRPLYPVSSVLAAINDELVELQATEVTPNSVGLKAFGLASLPAAWRRPFFVIPLGSTPSQAAIEKALQILGLNRDRKLIVRSSGIDESMDRRGALDSVVCDVETLAQQVQHLRTSLLSRALTNPPRVHWVVQELLPTAAKGHLSNEARIAEDKRDWMVEIEASSGHPAETRSIPLRTWRDNRPPREDGLSCPYREKYTQCLAVVARWAYERLIRVHFEWVWDGKEIYLVQADACDEPAGGVDPKDLVSAPKKNSINKGELRLFREATEKDYRDYRKLANARLYRNLGYEMIPFYVLDDQKEIQHLIDNEACSDVLRSDLAILVARPLVIRSDGRDVPDELKQMLPRSEELRSTAAAEAWLVQKFRTDALSKTQAGSSFAQCQPCLIAHHFVPATAAAWCQARPDHRRVRIESLWGLPEGLYWYAYDAYDVDTQTSSANGSAKRPQGMQIRERRRYKEHFIAPDTKGEWVLQTTAPGPAWQRSIRQSAWIEEIAWTSRCIAAEVGHPVVVMWFVDLPSTASKHRVLPWYHEQWKADTSPHKAAPRRKLSTTTDFILRDRSDWTNLQKRVEAGEPIVRIRIQPNDAEIVRHREFAEQLAAFAKKHRLVVELDGGVLSHAYYLLSREGCVVECADLDDYATDDYALEFNKLVRDLIPEAIAARGEAVTVLRLEGAALIAALRRKLVEESLEVLDAATSEDIAEEIADVREVIWALMLKLGISDADVESRRKRKLKARGGFERSLMLTKTAVAPSMAFRELQIDEEGNKDLAVATINREVEIPASAGEVHADRRVDSHGVHERQFTIEIPAHAGGYLPTRLAFDLPNQDGTNHEMVFELQVGRRGSNLRVRARLQNAAIQLRLDFGDLVPGLESTASGE